MALPLVVTFTKTSVPALTVLRLSMGTPRPSSEKYANTGLRPDLRVPPVTTAEPHVLDADPGVTHASSAFDIVMLSATSVGPTVS